MADSMEEVAASLQQTSISSGMPASSPAGVSETDGIQQELKVQTLTLRALVNTKDAGVIIGKGGKNVADLREKSGVRAGVSKAVPGVVDRVLSVLGTVDGIAQAYEIITLQMIEQTIVNDDATAQIPRETITMTIRFLIAHSVMGSIIGKQGSKIKQIQDECLVKMVALKEMLPQSTERIVEVTGTAAAIGKAAHQIAECLLQDLDRAQGTILFHPGAISPEGGLPSGHVGGYGGISVLGGGMSNQPQMLGQPQQMYGLRGANTFPGVGLGPAPRGGGNMGRSFTYNQAPHNRGGGPSSPSIDRRAVSNPNLPPGQISIGPDGMLQTATSIGGFEDPNLRTQNISFPNDMIGCIIGRGGTKISEIRKLSGSRINISKEPDPDTGERLFSIVGTTESNEKALFLLYSSLEAEKERRAQANAPLVP